MYTVVYSVLAVFFLYLTPGSAITASDQVQTNNAVRTILNQGGNIGQCPLVEERERARNELYQFAASVIANATNVTSIYTCNGTPGWRRVAFINMTDTSYNCPTGLNLTSYSKRTCGRSHTTPGGCSSTTFSVGSLPYSQVCGRIRGYQFGVTSAFFTYTAGIDSFYVIGISLTHGGAGSRQHIWTFAAGLSEVTTTYPNEGCPCDTAPSSVIPTFVGNDYFCESGLHSEWSGPFIFYADDVLWDGEDCTSTSTCCQLNNPPWFTKNLPSATTDNIELRLCTHQSPSIEDVPIELIELYVQ